MTAPAAIVASFVQPAARLAMGDSVGGAVGGFEALLAVLTQPLQGGADGQATANGETAPETTPKTTSDTPADTGDLAALLGQSGAAAWLTQAMSQTAPKAEEAAAPVTCAAPQAKGPLVDIAQVLPQAAATEQSATEPAAPRQSATQPSATDVFTQAEVETTPADPLAALLHRQAPEAVDPAILERIKPVKGQTAAQTLQSLLPTTPASAAPPVIASVPAEPVAAAAVAAQALATVQPTADDGAQTVAETNPAPAVIAPPVEARAAVAPRKAASASDGKVAKAEAVDAKAAPVVIAAAEETAETVADDLAPAPVAAREAETSEAPAHSNDTSLQTLAAKLETVAAGAAALAAQVRGAPETVAKFAAGILDKLNGQSTKFDLQLDPHGLGKVDVSVEIGQDGKLTAQMGFDSAVGLNELRGRAQELRNALEQAGFSLAEGALSFDFSGERRQQQTADGQADRSDQAGKAFARALGALDDELAAAPTRYQARQGLDLLI
ncbi:MAG: hypothetical protein JWR84_2255 [Caulobacter sp.]|nr:hypothetical protein [Caulobacter sp.]